MMFIGVDLAWRADEPRPRSSGVCILDKDGQVVELVLLTSDREILDRILANEEAWVGIDAPLRVPNQEGMRRCERQLMGMGVPCLPSNRAFMDRRYGGRRGERLARSLLGEGFAESPAKPEVPRAFFETYPYGALRVLGARVPRYKRGKFDERRRAISEAIRVLEAWDAPRALMEGLRKELASADNARMKGMGDLLDAALCATCVYSHRISGGRRTRLVGEAEHGYVLLPSKRNGDEGRADHGGGLPGGGEALRVQRG